MKKILSQEKITRRDTSGDPRRSTIGSDNFKVKKSNTTKMENLLYNNTLGRWDEYQAGVRVDTGRELVVQELIDINEGEMAKVERWRNQYNHMESDYHVHMSKVSIMNNFFAEHSHMLFNNDYGVGLEGANIMIESGMMLNNAKAYFLSRRELKWLYASVIDRRDAFVSMAEFWVHWRPVIERMWQADQENEVLCRIRFEVQLDGREVADFRRVERHIEEKGLWEWRISGPRSGSATKRRATKR